MIELQNEEMKQDLSVNEPIKETTEYEGKNWSLPVHQYSISQSCTY